MNDSLRLEFQSAGNGGQIEVQPSNGQYLLNGIPNATIGSTNNEIIYIPNIDFIGNDTMVVLYYQDGPVGPIQSYTTFVISVVQATVNARDDYAATMLNTPVEIAILENDEGSGALSLIDVALVNNGVVAINGDQIQYTPNEGFEGTARLTYTVCDSEFDKCDVATVAIFVKDILGKKDTTLVGTLQNQAAKALFSINNGIQEIDSPKNGNLILMDGGVSYQPDEDFIGLDTFTYAYDINDQTSLATFVVDVIPADAPNGYAIVDYQYTSKGNATTFNVLDNDLNDFLYVQSFTGSSFNGTVTHEGNGVFTYTPPSWLSGLDYFEYTVALPGTTSEETARVYILVNNHKPAEEEYELFSVINTPLIINYEIPISDFSFTEVSAPDNGDVVVYDGPSSNHSDLDDINGQAVIGHNVVVYYPNPGFKGVDAFDLEYCVGTDCKTITIYAEIRSMDMEEEEEENLCVNDCIWTGDTNKDGAVNMADLLPIGYSIGKVGVERIDASTDWYAQHSEEWNENIAGTDKNLKHVDTDGDGYISVNDTVAVQQYYGKHNNLTSGANIATAQVPLFFVPKTPNPAPGDLVEIDIILGTENYPATNIHGVTFGLNFNEDIVEPGSMRVDYDQDNWLSYGNTVMSMMKEPRLGRVESGYTRTTGVAAHGYGKLGTVSFIVVDEIIDGTRLRDTLTRVFHPQSLISMDVGGQYVEFYSEPFELNIAHNIDEPFVDDNRNLIAFPNPTADYLNVHVNGNNELEQILVRSITGQEVMTMSGLSGKQAQLAFDEHISNGIYLITAICDRGVYSQKIKLVR